MTSVIEISRRDFPRVEIGVRDFGKAIGGTARAERLYHRASIGCCIRVPDMVPSLREFRVELVESHYLLGGLESFLAPLRQVASTVHLERELRSWWYVDA